VKSKSWARSARRLGRWFALFAVALTASESQADVRVQRTAESIEIRGSGSVLPLAQRVAEAYMADHPQAIVVVSAGGDRRGLKSLILGTCDMAMAGSDVPEDLAKLALDAKVELSSAEVYQDAVVVVVDPDNPVSDLSMKQLRDVFRGAITTWRDLGGKDAPISLTTHEPTSGTFEVFKKTVLGEDAVIAPRASIVHHGELRQAITEAAIGYTGLHDAQGLKVLSVNGVEPNVATIAKGEYPIRRTLRLYQRKPETALGRAVLDYFLAPSKGQAFVRAMGDVPVHE
jgi:phosphate transport system substrate-binding protein